MTSFCRVRPIFLLICLLMALISCKENSSTRKGVAPIRLADFDTSSPVKTYEKIRTHNKKEIDSFYMRLGAVLTEQNRYPELLKHLDYYQKLNGLDQYSVAFILKGRGYAYNYVAEYDSANSCFQDAVAIYSKLGAQRELADVWAGLGTNYHYKADYDAAFSSRYKALKIYEQLKDTLGVMHMKCEMPIDYYYQKDYTKAIDTALSCLKYYKASGDEYMTAYMQTILATCYFAIDKFDSSLTYSYASLVIRRKSGKARELGESLNNLSLAYMGLKKWDSAIVSLRESLLLMQQAGDIRQITIIKQNLANCIWKTGNKAEAEKLLSEAIDDALKSRQKDAIANGYRKLYTFYRDERDFENALTYYQKYKTWKDSMFNEEKVKTIADINVKYETEKKEEEIVRLNELRHIDRIKKIAYLVFSVLILISAALAILFLTNRNRKNRLLIEKVKLELEANEKDLKNFTENIIAKNTFIEELEVKLTAIAATASQQEENEHLSELYQLKILTEDDWVQFKIKFDKVYPGFINRLRQSYPELAAGDQRQFLLIKLNIDNKECAGMLGISAESVKKNRYRLKKKFNLTEEDSLDQFVHSF